MNSALQSAIAGNRLSFQDAVELLVHGDWLEIAQAAWQIRCQRHAPTEASYTMFRVVNYSNICTIDCKFCSFQRYHDKPSKSSYVLTTEQVCEKVEQALEQNADQLFLQGGVHPKLPLDYYLEMVSEIKQRYGVHIRAFSPVEVLNMSQMNDCSIGDILDKLKSAGVDSIPGAGAELLVERMRKKLSPLKCTTDEWCDIMAECHQHGLTGSATMVIGGGETLEEIVMHLDRIRQIQDQTQGFHAFIPWVYQQQTKRFKVHPVRPDEFLKVLALSRVYLDNIHSIETSVMVLGKELAKIALRVGANDISSAVIEENVLKSYGLRSEAEARAFLETSGFTPRRRNFDYEYVDA